MENTENLNFDADVWFVVIYNFHKQLQLEIQDAQLSQRNRAVRCISFGQKLKTDGRADRRTDRQNSHR